MKLTENKKLYLVYFGIFGVIFILNCLTHRSIGDDYLYSFMWEGHSMYEPLSEHARRISSFSDIAISTYSYFMTWGGRIVAQALAMFFLWMPRMVFNVVVSLTTVLLVLCIQWIARGGKITMKLSAKEAALIFFCLWAFHANFVGVFIWTDGSCNYLFPMVCCWIGLFGFFYILQAYRKGKGKLWMLTGFLGLTIGYGLLMLAPGNFLRIMDSGENIQSFQLTEKKSFLFWINMIWQSIMWFYLWKAIWKRKKLQLVVNGKKYLRLALWLAINSWLFNMIMLFSPEFPNRSLFPGLIFCASAVFLIIHLASLADVHIIANGTTRLSYILGILYFAISFTSTLVWYVLDYQYEERVLSQATLLSGKNQVLVITEQPEQWNYLAGLHLKNYGLSGDEDKWQNVAFARFHDLKGVRLVKN